MKILPMQIDCEVLELLTLVANAPTGFIVISDEPQYDTLLQLGLVTKLNKHGIIIIKLTRKGKTVVKTMLVVIRLVSIDK